MCGGTPARQLGGDYSEVYPRVCGGTTCCYHITWRRKGLSPRVRGNQPPGVLPPAYHRSIPACAGEPASLGSLRDPFMVYPRVCGGTGQGDGQPPAVVGLSPRVRGNLPHPPIDIRRRRSIPACAGEPWAALGRITGPQVYPRVCGGTDMPLMDIGEVDGLSPRVRGNPGGSGIYEWTAGSIPACAGEPSPSSP